MNGLPINQIVCGDCVQILKGFPENSIDCVVTDPPYGIGFMGKEWDKALPPKEAFHKMFYVLKPGALAFIMSSPRQDVLWRMMAMLEGCGFQLRQSFISWVYKCVSDDTDVLTIEGWKGIDELDKNDVVCTFNKEEEQLEYQPLKSILRYNYDGTLVHIQNRDTDQLLTPNHRVLHKDRKHSGNRRWNGKWQFTEVQNLISHCGVNLPLAYPYNDYETSIGEDFAELLGWVLGEGWEQKESNGVNISQTETNLANVIRIRRLLDRLNFRYSEYEREREYEGEPYIEHQFHIHAKYGKKIRKWIPNGEPTLKLLHLPYNERQALFEALIRGEGSGELGSNLAFYQKSPKFREWFQLLCLHQGYRTSTNSEKKQYVSVSPRHTTQLQHRHFNPKQEECGVHKIQYNGRVWCVETSNGTFVARRNHKIFITGNSGFPKAYDVAKGIEGREKLGTANWSKWNKLEGEGELKERLGYHKSQAKQGYRPRDYTEKKRHAKVKLTSDLAKKWQGWKSITGLKPALEVILMVNKPLKEKTIVDNVLAHGVGAINIDACRIPFGGLVDKEKSKHNWKPDSSYPIDDTVYEYGSKILDTHQTERGRFPANLLVSDKALDTGKITKSAKSTKTHKAYGDSFKFGGGISTPSNQYDDSGGASRFFDLDKWAEHHGFLDVAKPSKQERNMGLESFPQKMKKYRRPNEPESSAYGYNWNESRPDGSKRKPILAKNVHPTVKPVKLMAYLIELGCPKDGVVLDPFVGSGTTCLASHQLGRKWIGIEINEDYANIARHRIATLSQHLTKFMGVMGID